MIVFANGQPLLGQKKKEEKHHERGMIWQKKKIPIQSSKTWHASWAYLLCSIADFRYARLKNT